MPLEVFFNGESRNGLLGWYWRNPGRLIETDGPFNSEAEARANAQKLEESTGD